uniref:Kinesin motor domain-containing protein n=1 Tax=Spongospora subterranea TaxID=70186 RepID=A0A0H5QHG8_9EUKA|eukprot:CRZ01418.1 hypothetical protein [Spongospora subterranea]
MSDEDGTSVRVAVRIRPILGNEKLQECRECIRRQTSNQIILGEQRLFTYDFCFGQDARQAEMYEQCVEPLLKSFVQGFNSTVMAYGQTGSGKSHTMGTESNGLSTPNEEKGILPRVIHDLFQYVKENSDSSREFSVRCSFLEIYNEELRDLLNVSSRPKSISIRETANGLVVPFGVEERHVSDASELLSCLEEGTVHRSTGSTLMNAYSSRSHAIFSVLLTQRRVLADHSDDINIGEGGEGTEFILSKFTFVDLAGSERLKKTGAEGSRRQEGININCGLLALGNVISALGDPSRKATHVPFRDSKVTRLLQDSLGGNSKTLMIACVSPADVHFEETLNTLRYAARARNIVNKPVIGRDPNSQKMEVYRQRILHLEAALSKHGIDPSQVSFSAGAFEVNESRVDSETEDLRNQLAEIRKENVYLDSEVLRLMALIKREKHGYSELKTKHFEAVAHKDAAQKALQDLVEQARSTGTLDVDSIVKRSDMVLSRDITAEVDNDESEKIIQEDKSDVTSLAGSDSEIENEVDELEVKRKKVDREFRRQNELNERALRRFDADIDHKNALIEQLLKRSLQSETLRQRYEEKIQEMENRVRLTQEERDSVMKTIGASRTSTQQEVEDIKTEFQSRLLSMTSQLEELRRKFRDNQKILRSRPKDENQIASLRDDISRIKKQRVMLQRQMREEADKHRFWVQEHHRQVAALQKQLRKDSVQIARMHERMYQQDLVMKAKTQKNTLLQKELTEAMKRKVDSRVRPGHPSFRKMPANIKDVVRRVIGSAVQARDMGVQRRRLLTLRSELETKLSDLMEQNDAYGDHHVNVKETIDDTKAELEFVKSQIYEANQSEKVESSYKRTGSRPGEVDSNIFRLIGIDEDNLPAFRVLILYLFNFAIKQRVHLNQSRKRQEALEAEILQVQNDMEASAARLEVNQRECDRKLIVAVKESERERQAMLTAEFGEQSSIRELETQLSQVKRQQSQLLSPIAEHGRTRCRTRGVVNPVVSLPKAYSSKKQHRRARSEEPTIRNETSSRVQRLSPDIPDETEDIENKSVLDRLTDKTRFTGTSRYSGRTTSKITDADADLLKMLRPLPDAVSSVLQISNRSIAKDDNEKIFTKLDR